MKCCPRLESLPESAEFELPVTKRFCRGATGLQQSGEYRSWRVRWGCHPGCRNMARIIRTRHVVSSFWTDRKEDSLHSRPASFNITSRLAASCHIICLMPWRATARSCPVRSRGSPPRLRGQPAHPPPSAPAMRAKVPVPGGLRARAGERGDRAPPPRSFHRRFSEHLADRCQMLAAWMRSRRKLLEGLLVVTI